MDSKIQELTEKVYKEGVERGQVEAERIINEATARATELEAKAKAEAAEIVRQAQRSAEELRHNTQNELRLYANQLIESLRARITERLTGDIVTDNVRAVVTDPDFMKRLILELIQRFDVDRGVEILSPQAETLRAYFAANAKALLERGVHITDVSGHPTDVTLRPVDGSFKIQIGEEELIELFKSFLRPQLSQQLF